MSGDSLRDALEKLADEWDRWPNTNGHVNKSTWFAQMLRDALGKHPAEPASERLWPADAYPEHMSPADPVGVSDEPAKRCTCDPGPEGQHRHWCDLMYGEPAEWSVGVSGELPRTAAELSALSIRTHQAKRAQCQDYGIGDHDCSEHAVGVSDEAVEAAAQAYMDTRFAGARFVVTPKNAEGMRAALEAAQPFMQPQVVASPDQIDALLWEHRTVASNSTQTVCACDRAWRSDTEHRTHLRDAVLALMGGAETEACG